jgi:cardiolipin synthase
MLDAIARAKTRVHLETYILAGDRLGLMFLEALADRAADGLEVRLLYDALGCRSLAPGPLDALRMAGVEVVAFNPLRRFYPHWAPRRRDHRKILIVDGEVAFTGGLNLAQEYDAEPVTSADGPGWRDTHLALRGPVVRDLGAVFLESWFRAGGTDLPWHALLDARPGHAGSVRCAVLPDGPVYRRRALRDLLVRALDRTEATARLTSPYFVPDRVVQEALERTAERGVRVELILAGVTDHPLLRRGARYSYERLLSRGIAVHEYVAAMLHAKSAVFDGKLAIVGSSNLDRQSLQHSYEVNVVMVGSDVPPALEALFEADIGRSVELTQDGLASRSTATRMVDACAAALVRAFI